MDNIASNDTKDRSTSHLNASASDDELTRLNRAHEGDRKMVIAGLIIENTFTSILDMVLVIINEHIMQIRKAGNDGDSENAAADLLNVGSTNRRLEKCGARCLGCLKVFLKYFITNNWDSGSKVSQIVVPSLYLSGAKDELIPPKQMQSLFRRAQQGSVLPILQSFEEGDHNSTWMKAGQKYWDDILAFVTTTSVMAEQRRSSS